MTHVNKILFIAGLSLLVNSAAQAGMYKWTDEQGNVHYSQSPPRGQEYEKMKVDKAPRPSGTTVTPPATTGSQATGQSDGPGTVEDEVAKNAEIRKKNCDAAKKNLQVFQVYRRVKGEDGKIRVVSEKEREEQIQRSKEAIREFCD